MKLFDSDAPDVNTDVYLSILVLQWRTKLLLALVIILRADADTLLSDDGL